MQVSDRDLWLLNFYRNSELHGALLMGRLARTLSAHSHVYTVVGIDLNAGTITVRNPWATDAGGEDEAWVQGANDGYVTYTLASFTAVTEVYTVGFM